MTHTSINLYNVWNLFRGPGPAALGPFGHMGNINWMILRFQHQKCTHFFSDPDPPISDLIPIEKSPTM